MTRYLISFDDGAMASLRRIGPTWPRLGSRSSRRPRTAACGFSAPDWNPRGRASWPPTGRSPAARARRPRKSSAGSQPPGGQRVKAMLCVPGEVTAKVGLRTFTHGAAGNYALSRALTWGVAENRAGRPTTTFPCCDHQQTAQVRVSGLQGLPASIVGDPQVGSVFKAPGPLSGTFLVQAAGLCGMLPWPPCPGISEEKSVARPGQRQTGARRSAPRERRRVRHRDDVVSVLARTVREVEAAALRGRVTPAVRTKFQAVALLLREERARVWAAAGSDSHRAEQLKRLDGIATILATTAVQDAGLLALLNEGSGVSDAARSLEREMLRDLGIERRPKRSRRRRPLQLPPARSGGSCRSR